MKHYYVMIHPTTKAVIVTTQKYINEWLKAGFVIPQTPEHTMRKVS